MVPITRHMKRHGTLIVRYNLLNNVKRHIPVKHLILSKWTYLTLGTPTVIFGSIGINFFERGG